MTKPYVRFKRVGDVVLAAAGLVVVSPILAISAVAIKMDSAGPAFFTQQRVGRGERTFSMHKLRSMTVNHGTATQTYDTSPGVTRVGRLLRRTKVDELPQLWNVLVGDMSLIGPRPPLPATLMEMPEWARRRFVVRPGLTGLAQVNGNVALAWEDRWRYDVAYVDRVSLRTDLHILMRTVVSLLLGERHPHMEDV